jgi:hypothetical protein
MAATPAGSTTASATPAAPAASARLRALVAPLRRLYEPMLAPLEDDEAFLRVLCVACDLFEGTEAGTEEAEPFVEAVLENLHVLCDYPAEDHSALPWYTFANPFAANPPRASVLPLALPRAPAAARAVVRAPYPQAQRAVSELFNADIGPYGQFHRHYNNYLTFAAVSCAKACGGDEARVEAFLRAMLRAEAGVGDTFAAGRVRLHV